MRRTRRGAPVVLLGFLLSACGGDTAAPAGTTAPVPAQPAPAGEGPGADGRMTEIHPGAGGSPHVRVEWVIDGADVSVTYGRPYLKGRTIGDTIEPMRGQVWRLGADEATTLRSDRPLTIGGAAIPSGEHSLWVLDTGETWQLIVNSQTGQMGTEYTAARDVARIPMTVRDAATPAEQLTISIRDGELAIEWGDRVATASFEVDTAMAP